MVVVHVLVCPCLVITEALVLHVVEFSAGLVNVTTSRTALVRNTTAPERIEEGDHRGVQR
jgi:hypothetical protein